MSLSIAAFIAMLLLGAGHAGGVPSAYSGCTSDPNGCPRASSDSLSLIDPNGRAHASGNAGVRLNPDG